MRTLAAGIIAALVTLAPIGAFAQQDMGTITGTVTDPSGGVLPGVTVTATEQATGVAITVVTNETGLYAIPSLKVGTYTVEAALEGFKKALTRNLPLSAGTRVAVDFKLDLGSLTDDVTVIAESPLLKTENASLSQVLKDKEMRELPVVGRNFQTLGVLAAGVQPALGHTDQQGGFNAHGQWATQNNFIVDGIDNNSQVLGLQDRKAQVLLPSLDAIQEFQVQTSNYSAEFGRSAGAVMNVTIKSGTNRFGGTLYEFHRNDRFDSRPTFSYTDRDGDGKPDPDGLLQNQFGGTFGGPVRRDRTFFFGSVEATRTEGEKASLVTVPSLLELQGNFSGSGVTVRDPATGLAFANNTVPTTRWDPVAAAMVARLWPKPKFSGATRDNYVSAPESNIERDQYDVRVDHNFTSNNRAFIRVSHHRLDSVNFGPLPVPAVGATNNTTARDESTGWNSASSFTRIFSSSVVSESRVGFSYLNVDKFPLSDGFPNADFGLGVFAPEPIQGLARILFAGSFPYAAVGESANNPNHKESRTLQLLNNVSILKGKHNFKAGADIRFIQSNAHGSAQARGQYQFNGRFTGSSFGDFLLGWPSQIVYNDMQDANLREQDYMFYVQDDWKLAPNVTVNVGVRYELNSPMYDADDQVSTLDRSVLPTVSVIEAGANGDSWSDRALIKTDRNNVAPRLGFSWQPSSLYNVRGGVGIFYGTSGGGLGNTSRMVSNWPYYRNVTIASTTTRPARQLSLGLDESLLGSTTVMPQNVSWQVWEPDFQLPTIYQWNVNVQRQIGSLMVASVSYVGSITRELPRTYNINGAGIGDPATERQRRLVPTMGSIVYRETSGRAHYNSLETNLEKRMSSGWQVRMSYTWSRSIDDTVELLGDEYQTGIVQDWRNLRADEGRSTFNREHRFVTNAIWQLPFGTGHRWLREGGVADWILGGWQISGIMQLMSGQPWNPTIANPTQFLGVTESVWRPDLVGDPSVSNPSPNGWVNAAAFAIPRNADGSYRFGTMERNSLTGPGYFNLDMAMMKSFTFGANTRVQLRAEAFNVLNTPSYGIPERNLSSPDFGKIRTTVNSPRQMQFGIKFLF